jgi:hypothetical protein
MPLLIIRHCLYIIPIDLFTERRTTQSLLQDWNVFTRTTERVSRMEELASYAIELHRNIDRIYIVSV